MPVLTTSALQMPMDGGAVTALQMPALTTSALQMPMDGGAVTALQMPALTTLALQIPMNGGAVTALQMPMDGGFLLEERLDDFICGMAVAVFFYD